MHKASVAVALVAATVVAAGCGQSRVARGKAVFGRSCSGCHTVAGRESGAVGGDLVNAHLGLRALASFARIMPTRKQLSRTDARAVAAYVHTQAVILRAKPASHAAARTGPGT